MSEKFTGKVIAFEGLDGAGKTTHISQLVDDLENAGLRVAAVACPSKSLVGSIMRRNIGVMEPEQKTNLFTYDLERTQRTIPRSVDVAIWDRHLDTIMVSNTDDGEEEVEKRAGKIKKPDTVIYLDIPPTVSWEREGSNTDHPLDLEWVKAKDRRYKALREKHPERFDVVDATAPLHLVYQAILGIAQRELAPVLEKSKDMHKMLLSAPGVVRFLQDNPFEVKPGVYLPMFVNLKNTWSNPELREKFVERLAELISDEYDWICGLESGGSFYATSIATLLKKPVSLYRKGDKEYGDKNFMVGETPPPGTRVALLDDVYATGQSASRAVNQLKSIGCPTGLFAIYSYSNDVEMKARLGSDATALTYFKGIRQLAREQGILNEEQAASLTKQVDTYRHSVFQ
jgi:thymidylate kinase/orotate phosphoribosyltransferase